MSWERSELSDGDPKNFLGFLLTRHVEIVSGVQ